MNISLWMIAVAFVYGFVIWFLTGRMQEGAIACGLVGTAVAIHAMFGDALVNGLKGLWNF